MANFWPFVLANEPFARIVARIENCSFWPMKNAPAIFGWSDAREWHVNDDDCLSTHVMRCEPMSVFAAIVMAPPNKVLTHAKSNFLK